MDQFVDTPAGKLRYLAYFSGLGLGFMFIEIVMMQKMVLFLGHPVYALSVVLAALLASTGIGSLISGRFALRRKTAAWILDARWANVAVRTTDWLMLAAVVFHAFMGVRTIVGDYTRGGVRTTLTMLIYIAAFVVFAMGTFALVSVPNVLPRA